MEILSGILDPCLSYLRERNSFSTIVKFVGYWIEERSERKIMHKIFIREYIEYSIFVLASNRITLKGGTERTGRTIQLLFLLPSSHIFSNNLIYSMINIIVLLLYVLTKLLHLISSFGLLRTNFFVSNCFFINHPQYWNWRGIVLQ